MTIFAMVTTGLSTEYTRLALDSFYQHTTLEPHERFILIDNDGGWSGSDYPQFELQINEVPRGFSSNMNQMIERARTEKQHLIMLNNDLILSPNWLDALMVESESILSPLSNRELQYEFSGLNLGVVVELSHYLGQEDKFLRIVAEHRKRRVGLLNVLTLPFFCVKVPYLVHASVGLLDETFGLGGGEDYDYCLRAIEAGFKVKYCLNSYILHFGGKSTYTVEVKAAQLGREHIFRERFKEKWGNKLYDLVLCDKLEIARDDPVLNDLVKTGDLKSLIERLRV